MAKYQDMAMHKMRSNITQNYFLKDITLSPKFSNKYDLQAILELLNTTNDINFQLKLFSALSACLMFNKDTNVDIIIKSSAVYDRIHNVLTKGLPRKATGALHFLSALLYVDAEEDCTRKRRTLALYARNMTRISGCLGVMADMFTNCMMYHDTWKALCQCLAISCSGCESNQSYCTHLIPVCIQKCSQTNMDIFLLLQSLMLNHNRNIQLFLDCNGTDIFTRELLHYDKSLQLLITVVQCSTAMTVLLRQTKVLDDLRDFVCLYGPGSQIGQKAMIILNHIESRSRELDYQIPRNLNKGKPVSKIKCRNDRTSSEMENELDDTKTLMQNVLKEVFNYKQNELRQKEASNIDVNSLIQSTSTMVLNSANREMQRNTFNKMRKLMDQHRRNRLHSNVATELSFSFLQNHYKGRSRNRNHFQNEIINKTKIYNSIRTEKVKKNTETQTSVNIEKDLRDTMMSDEQATPVDLEDFRPIFSSTPKHEGENANQIDLSTTITLRKSNFTSHLQVTKQRPTKVEKRTRKKVPQNKDKDFRNRSLSSRFFRAINESCTTFVKTVANIFKKKATSDSSEDSISRGQSRFLHLADDPSCSFSFLNYMKNRDAFMNDKKKRNKSTDFSLETRSCETCDDTEVLKKKIVKNEHLKQTVKKLKLGINLYGCDFKKISRTMWPRESYMTPVVLYNLYRKLLLK